LSQDLEILLVEYDEWSDILMDGIEKKYFVEKVIMNFDKNPFENELVKSFYTLQVRTDYIYSDNFEYQDTGEDPWIMMFNGKFKVYSALEIEKGKEWTLDRVEIAAGYKDIFGVYRYVDEHAKFRNGEQSIINLISTLGISKRDFPKDVHLIIVKLIVDEQGKVDPKSIRFERNEGDESILEKFRNSEPFLNDWKPAKFNGKPVKSAVYIPLSRN
jgi:hypothetical protein